MIPVHGIEHIGVFAQDTERLSAWYRGLFGGREVSRSDGDSPIIFLSFGGGALLEIIPSKDDGASADGGSSHVCFGVSDLTEASAGLSEREIELVKPEFTAYDGSRVVFFQDPEGNTVQLVERIPNSAVHAAAFPRQVK